ncbi:MAG TPA: hypothetical protein VG456_16825 [Candidatus Sulfopaludibacter sp.]|jgi:hypothetical protein|nr:hypothetical protein [Candidatus Sulfopaludibacter sp.]
MKLARKIRLGWKYRSALRMYLRLRRHRRAFAIGAGLAAGVMLVCASRRRVPGS